MTVGVSEDVSECPVSKRWLVRERGFHIFYRLTTPPVSPASVPPRGVILMLHGMAGHSGRFTRAAQFFASQGLVCVALDQRGHGRTWDANRDTYPNVLDPGPLGWPGLVHDAMAVLDEALDILDCHDLPLYLIGHSQGSVVAQCLLLSPSGAAFTAAILTGYEWLCSKADIVHEHIVLDEYGVDAITRQNPVAPVRHFHNLLAMVSHCMDTESASAIPHAQRTPTLYLSGADDSAGAFGVNVTRQHDFMHRQGWPVEMSLIEGMRHSVWLYGDDRVHQSSLDFLTRERHTKPKGVVVGDVPVVVAVKQRMGVDSAR
ncbi:hypothetical protein KIPB_009874 [Kipferlia bialata]|uniref:Serine aminopeptidase S33 domain-containing protein n=1 Tax=Kipferlia bialata TaxID=797122 RepID=A0A9K3D4G7_9EUKA|nr:hypothetical protein KIPB_009874 [Kipferlia bialata]|eukprot:g9874.t1